MNTPDGQPPQETMMSHPNSDDLLEALQTMDSRSEAFDEHDVRKSISSVLDGRELSSLPMEYKAEMMAFDFKPKFPHGYSAWGTDYGPKLIFPHDGGHQIAHSTIQDIRPEMLTYWDRRAREATHPILCARYADLVWDFSREVIGQGASIDMPRLMIDSVVTIARSNDSYRVMDTIKKLQRALSVAISINDSQRTESVRDAILDFRRLDAEDDKPGLWVFRYDFLIDQSNVPLTPSQRDEIVQDLEGRLRRLANPPEGGEIHLVAAEAAAIRLAKFYRRHNQREEMKRVLLAYGALVEKKTEVSPALTASSWLQHVYGLYLSHGLREEAQRVAIILRQGGARLSKNAVFGLNSRTDLWTRPFFPKVPIFIGFLIQIRRSKKWVMLLGRFGQPREGHR